MIKGGVEGPVHLDGSEGLGGFKSETCRMNRARQHLFFGNGMGRNGGKNTARLW